MLVSDDLFSFCVSVCLLVFYMRLSYFNHHYSVSPHYVHRKIENIRNKNENFFIYELRTYFTMRVYVRSCNENSLHYTLYADLAEDDVVTGVSINLKPRLSFKDEFPFYTEY